MFLPTGTTEEALKVTTVDGKSYYVFGRYYTGSDYYSPQSVITSATAQLDSPFIPVHTTADRTSPVDRYVNVWLVVDYTRDTAPIPDDVQAAIKALSQNKTKHDLESEEVAKKEQLVKAYLTKK